MKFTVSARVPAGTTGEAVLIALFQPEPGKAARAVASPRLGDLDGELPAAVTEALELGAFTGKPLQLATVVRPGARLRRVWLVGLGRASEVRVDHLRQAVGQAARAVREAGIKRLAIAVPEAVAGTSWAETARAVAEGVQMALYRLDTYRTKGLEDRQHLDVCHLWVPASRVAEAKEGVRRGEVLAEAVCWVRDLVNHPSNHLQATQLAEVAQKMAKERGLACRIFDKPELEKLGFGCLLGVNQGSVHPPRFIVVEYRGGAAGAPPVALVGKGVTFDTGGICIKPAAGMDEMKTDMAGGATVLGTLRALADLKVPVNAVGLVPTTDNMPSGSAMRPGDVLKSYSGQTVEVVDTDAEGRLILSDALAYADKHFAPAAIIDLATLTGSCIVALGSVATGLFTNDQSLVDRVRAAGDAEGERAWQLPTWPVYDDYVESDIADLKNADERKGDAIAAAVFLSKFVGDRPWVHMDIAGTSWTDKDKPYAPKGATGAGLRTLVRMLSEWQPAAPKAKAATTRAKVRV